MQNRKRDTDVQNRLLDSVGEGEGGMFRENNIKTCILSKFELLYFFLGSRFTLHIILYISYSYTLSLILFLQLYSVLDKLLIIYCSTLL